jgi:hypothetical protein
MGRFGVTPRDPEETKTGKQKNTTKKYNKKPTGATTMIGTK